LVRERTITLKVINLTKELKNFVCENTMKVFELLSETAEKFSPDKGLFLIGGTVRDILLNQKKIKNFDIDIVFEGNAVEFARFAEKTFPKIIKIKEIHEDFKTAKILFVFENFSEEIDIASTRKEIYPISAALPELTETGCSLAEDVLRRDFTINSLGISLQKQNFGELKDFLGGYDDILAKKIKILHPKSFIDDPTRIIRALKFRVRFDFELEENTKLLQNEVISSKKFDNLCGERIKSEFKQTFNLNSFKVQQIFVKEQIYSLIDTEISNFPKISDLLEKYADYFNKENIWLIYLGLFIRKFSKEKITKLAKKLNLSNFEKEILLNIEQILTNAKKLNKNCSNFEIYEFFRNFSNEAVVAFLSTDIGFEKMIKLYLKDLKEIKIYTTGDDLIKRGLKPDPSIGKTLNILLKAKINGEFFTKTEEIHFLDENLQKILKNH